METLEKTTKKRTRLLLILILSIGVLFFSKNVLLKKLGTALIYESHDHSYLAKTDLMIVLGGGGGDRIKKSLELYPTLNNPDILYTGGRLFNTSIAHMMEEYAKALGSTAQKVHLEPNSKSTHDDARLSLALAKKLQSKHILVITSKYHSKRSYTAFKRRFKHYPATLIMIPSNDGIDYENWWKNSENGQLITIEWIKTIWYWIRKT